MTKLPQHHENKKPRNIIIFCLVGSVIMGGFSWDLFHRQGDVVWGSILAVSTLVLLMASAVMGFRGKRELGTWIVQGLLFCLFSLLILRPSIEISAHFWIFVLPLTAFYTKGLFKGTLISSVFALVVLVYLFFSFKGNLKMPFSSVFYLKFLLVYSIMSLMTFLYETTVVRRENHINRQIYYNTLTQLPNRTKMIEDIKKTQDHTLMLINIDAFKEVNDLFGSKQGDAVLVETGSRLLRNCSVIPEAVVYKLHADEYAVLIPGQDRETIEVLAERIYSSLSEDYYLEETTFSITVSIGISYRHKDLLAAADIALKQAKDKKISYAVFDREEGITQKFKVNIQLIHTLKKGLNGDGILPYFQPIYSNKEGSISKYECLVRLRNGNEVLSPACFLDLSKRVKLYSEVTRIMIKKSIDHFRDLPYEFSVNLCKDDLLNPGIRELIDRELRDRSLAERMVFELLETEQMEDTPEIGGFISSVKAAGAKVAIDDFGSGYSNFEYLLRMKVDYIKIDSILIKNIVENRNSQILIENIVDFCKKLNILTIAEFVHNQDVYSKVKELGIDFSQGYYLGVPAEKTINPAVE